MHRLAADGDRSHYPAGARVDLLQLVQRTGGLVAVGHPQGGAVRRDVDGLPADKQAGQPAPGAFIDAGQGAIAEVRGPYDACGDGQPFRLGADPYSRGDPVGPRVDARDRR
jgi:hypothetical protein